MHISTFRPGGNETFDDFIDEIERRQDIENLTVDEFIDAFAETIDKDTTTDMVLQNLQAASSIIKHYKKDRIFEILFMKHGFEVVKEKQLEVLKA